MKTAIITGGATGIGAAISSLLAENGYNCVIAYNKSQNKADCLCKELLEMNYSAVSFRCDVTDAKSVKALFDFTVNKYGTIDLLVSNAGIAEQKLFTDITDEDWSKMITTNLTGCFNCCREASRVMIPNHKGNIINISSMWGVVGASCEVHYSAAKAGVIGLTKALAKELAPSNIRVNCVAPGVIKTSMIENISNDDINNLINETPLSRLGTPNDVAEAVLFFASEKSSFITGQVLSVDGGFIL